MEKDRSLSFAVVPVLARNIRRLLTAAWHNERGLVIGLAASSLFIAAMPFVQSGTIALLINNLIENAGIGKVSPVIIALLAVAIAAMIASGLIYSANEFQTKRFWIRMSEKFELTFLKKKGELDIARYDDPKFNDLLNNATERGTFPMSNLLEMQFANLQNVVGVMVASAIIIGSYPLLFLLILGGLIPRFIVGLKYGKDVWGIFDSGAEDRRKFFDLRRHFFWVPGVAELKLFQNVERFHDLARGLMRSFNKKQERTEEKKLRLELGARLLSEATLGICFGFLMTEVIKGSLQIGTLTFLLASMSNFSGSTAGFFLSVARQYEMGLFVNDIFKVLDTPRLIALPLHPIHIETSRPPAITFENVSFLYPDSEVPALKNLSLAIEIGEKMALVGANGSGKTTVVKLICRFYDPTEGRVLINGTDLRDIDPEEWYGILGVLFQDYSSYNFLVKDVIALGRSNGRVKLAKVLEASQASEADSFIQRLKHQYGQQLGKWFTGGVDLSEGERQKLALARAFYRDPRMLILDEPTSSIDAESEANIFTQLNARKADRTLLLISHRFSTVRRADRICVLENGSATEVGTHRELMQLDGTYARLFRIQAKEYRA